jgi:hypothetical protein
VGENSVHHRSWVAWFHELPLWIEEPGFRVVHACWSPAHVAMLRPQLGDGERLTPDLVKAASCKDTSAYEAVEVLLKGLEVALPPGAGFRDKEGHERRDMRTRWWDRTLTTYRAAYQGPPGADIPDTPMVGYTPPPTVDRPTFIGHYWLPFAAPPAPLSPRVACVDYSVARGGPLAAYRFDGESELKAEKFVTV